MPSIIKFKTDKEEKEWNELSVHNSRLKRLVQSLAEFVELEFHKEIVLTEIYRTQEEFDRLYAATPVEKRPGRSPHQIWQAVDLRSSLYTPREIERMLAFLNQYTYLGGQRKVGVYHAVAGNVMHFHIQYA